MKKNYINPQLTILSFDTELIIAASDKMERGVGSGGNQAEVKGQINSSDYSNPVDWDDDWK